MKYLSLALILCITSTAFADKSTYLDQGSITPYDGFLLDRDKASKVRLLDIDLQEAIKTKEYLQKDNDLYIQRLENVSKENDKLATQLTESRDTSFWSKIGFFLIGSAVTTAIVYGTSRAIR